MIQNIKNIENNQLQMFTQFDFNQEMQYPITPIREDFFCDEIPLFKEINYKEQLPELQLQSFEQITTQDMSPFAPVQTVVQKNNKPLSKDYNKNICRYITRQAIRCLVSKDYAGIVTKKFCQGSANVYRLVTEYYLSVIENITGISALKEQLIIIQTDNYNTKVQKKVFIKFFRWYLKHRAIRYIIKGNMKNKEAFIQYKNKILMFYLNGRLEEWQTNSR